MGLRIPIWQYTAWYMLWMTERMSTCGDFWEVRRSESGEGLFAPVDIPAGTGILDVWGRTLSFDDTLHFKNKESYCLQIAKDKYIALHFPVFLCNHSCEPNCGIKDGKELASIKDIAKGEELRWDYSTSMMERHWRMACRCGASTCRHMIDDFDTLPMEIQEKYIKAHVVMPYILDLLKEK